MNWYIALRPDSCEMASYFDGSGVLVFENPIQCWEYLPVTTYTEIWQVFPTREVEMTADGYGKAPGAFLQRRVELWELAAYSDAKYGCASGIQRITSSQGQKVFAFEEAIVSAHNYSSVKAWGSTLIVANDQVVVEAWEDSQVVLLDQSRCYAHDSAKVMLVGQNAAVTYPVKSKVKTTLIDANPNNVLSDGRFFNADQYAKRNQEVEEIINEYREQSFWDVSIEFAREDRKDGTDPHYNDAGQSRAQRGCSALASLFGEDS